MMTEKAKALRLADQLETDWHYKRAEHPMLHAAAKLRRLHAINGELLEALQVMLRDYTAVHDIGDVEMQPAIYQARAAIANATKEAA